MIALIFVVCFTLHFSSVAIPNKDVSGNVNQPNDYSKLEMFSLSLKSTHAYTTEIQNQEHVADIYNKIVQILRNNLRADPTVLECGHTYNDSGYLSIRFRVKYEPDKCPDLRTLAAIVVRLLDEVQFTEATCGNESVSFF